MSSMRDYDRLSFVIVDGNLQRYQGDDPHVVIPDGVTKISKAAFKNKLGIESITVPGTVQNLGIDTFSQIYSLKELILESDSAKFTSVNGALCSADSKKLLMVPRGRETFEIPASVIEIGKAAFSGCGKMQTVVFPATVTAIGAEIFGYASPLHIVVCNPSAVIDENAFPMEMLEKCFLYGTLDVSPAILKSVKASIKRSKKTYSEKIIRADDPVAMGRFLSLWNPPKVEEIEGYIKMAESAQSAGILQLLRENYSTPESADKLSAAQSSIENEDTLKNWRKRLKLSASNGNLTVTGYSGTDVNVTIPKEIEGQKITEIKSRAFFVCRFIQSVHILASIPAIRAGTFGGCSSLETVTLPERLTTIGRNAFWDCKNLKDITLPDTVASIEDSAFQSCTALETIALPDSVTIVGKNAFAKCSNLKRILLSDNLDSISAFAFEACSSLEEITIPQKVTQIDTFAFIGCSSLKKIVVSENVRYIAHNAFNNCKNLMIHASVGSYAEQFAKENNIPFVAE